MGICQLALEVEKVLVSIILENILKQVCDGHERVAVELVVVQAHERINRRRRVRHLALTSQRAENGIRALRLSQHAGVLVVTGVLSQNRHESVGVRQHIRNLREHFAHIGHADGRQFALDGSQHAVSEEVGVAVDNVIRSIVQHGGNRLFVAWVSHVAFELVAPLVDVTALAYRDVVLQVLRSAIRSLLSLTTENAVEPVPDAAAINLTAVRPGRIKSNGAKSVGQALL